ncbi:MAG: aldehyde dehydrogenase family protein, partial [Actinomyces sp.]
RVLVGPGDEIPGTGFVRPSIVEVPDPAAIPDEEVFAPVLSLVRVPDTTRAIEVAAATRYGLAAGIVTTDRVLFETFARRVPAGIVNLNSPTTGASGRLPFGGVGRSGNHRPAGWTTADHVADPVASTVRDRPAPPAPLPGLPTLADREVRS